VATVRAKTKSIATASLEKLLAKVKAANKVLESVRVSRVSQPDATAPAILPAIKKIRASVVAPPSVETEKRTSLEAVIMDANLGSVGSLGDAGVDRDAAGSSVANERGIRAGAGN
jgi:hypothetical protein